MSEPQDDQTVLKLNADESLVLFEFLSAFTQGDEAGPLSPELVVLNGMLCDLERQLSAPLAADYAERLEAARQAIGVG